MTDFVAEPQPLPGERKRCMGTYASVVAQPPYAWTRLTAPAAISISLILLATSIVMLTSYITLAPLYVGALVLLNAAGSFVYHAVEQSKQRSSRRRLALELLAGVVERRDQCTADHTDRVAGYCAGILRELGVSHGEREAIISAARVHDIGKIGIPDAILNKRGPLTPDEWDVMKTHPILGAQALAGYPEFEPLLGMVRHHHEQWNSAGYPDGLAGEAIPFGARVIAVVDSFDAMTSDRPYRPGMSSSAAAEVLRRGRGEQWDAHVVDAFLRTVAATAEQQVIPPSADAGLPIKTGMFRRAVRGRAYCP